MNELTTFKNEAKKRDLCGNYSAKWDSCKSKKQLFDLAMDANGMPYICEAIADGWGVSPEYICDKFKSFINGKYISNQGSWGSRMYVSVKDMENPILVDVTAVVLIDCECVVNVPDGAVCNIYAVNSKVKIVGRGIYYLYKYGNSIVEK